MKTRAINCIDVFGLQIVTLSESISQKKSFPKETISSATIVSMAHV